MRNAKALPKIITKPILLFVLNSGGETIYILDPIKNKFTFIYTLEDGVYTKPCSKEDFIRLRQSFMSWHWIATKGLVSSRSGRILHWEYL